MYETHYQTLVVVQTDFETCARGERVTPAREFPGGSMIFVTSDVLDDLSVGAAVLGTGGGGDPYIGKLLARAAIDRYGPVKLLELGETPDDARIAACGGMGAPTILIEKLPSGDELNSAFDAYEKTTGEKLDAIMPFEAGGMNSMAPIILAAKRGLPVIDADGMGRAFPQIDMETFNVYGVSASPVALADERGDTVVVRALDEARSERLARVVTIRMGGQSWIVNYGMSGEVAKRVSVPGTMSLAIGIGRTIRESRAARRDTVVDLIEFFSETPYKHAKLICTGKITDVERVMRDGWSVGVAKITPFDTARKPITISIQNEFLMAKEEDHTIAVVPDLICVLDADTCEPITTERLRYGQRVHILAIQAPPILCTPEALAVFGPRCFGLDQDYVPLSG